MKNLAGNKEADKDIERELLRCGVEPIRVLTVRGEVPATVIGVMVVPGLGTFRFERRWYYWSVDGPVPLAIAEELYAMEHHRDIRSGGDCGCRPPATWACARKGEQTVVTPEETKQVRELK